MKKHIIAFLLVLGTGMIAFNSFANTTDQKNLIENESKVSDPREVTYSSYNFIGDGNTEYIKVVFKYDYSELQEIYYWSDIFPDIETEFNIIITEKGNGIESSWDGIISFPDSDNFLSFTIIGNTFNLKGDNYVQPFEYLKTEY